jgi:hypothetical protein
MQKNLSKFTNALKDSDLPREMKLNLARVVCGFKDEELVGEIIKMVVEYEELDKKLDVRFMEDVQRIRERGSKATEKADDDYADMLDELIADLDRLEEISKIKENI